MGYGLQKRYCFLRTFSDACFYRRGETLMNSDSLDQHRAAPGAYYRIKVKGILAQSLAAPLSDLQIQHEDNITTLVGYVHDRATLRCLLRQMHHLGLPLLWVQRTQSLDSLRYSSVLEQRTVTET